MISKIKTPCIGVCSTGIGDSVCRGCKRYAHEVINWNAYDEGERAAIFERLEYLLSQVVQTRLRVTDASVLLEQMEKHGQRVSEHLSEYCIAYEAIRVFGASLPSIEVIGCKPLNEWSHLSVKALKDSIETNFYDLSCAHYQRYFPGHL